MVSAREFCRLPNYPISVLLTYSFDPLFFERVPWSDLTVGGSRRIVVAADARRVSEAMLRCAGQTARLGSQYVLAETGSASVFHPKLIARLSEEGGRVWIGSGNLTYTGWGGNRELATSWPVGPGEEDKGSWLNEVLETVANTTASTTFSDQIREIRAEAPWLMGRSEASPIGPVLLGTPDRPLSQQLAQRWRGRSFNELRICTGSTDIDGAFLAWAQRTFGVKNATVCLSPAHASFDPASLAKLNLKVSIIKAPPEYYMHAKFYWFSGQDGPAAIMGSANCSAAAWFGRNVELVVAYDKPEESEFASVLSIFDAKALSPDQVLSVNPLKSATSADAAWGHQLVSLRLRSAGVIEALLHPPLASNARAELLISGASDKHRIPLAQQSRGWSGRLPADLQMGVLTPFAHVEGMSGGTPFKTELRWIDNDVLLERATRSPVMDQGLSALSRRQFAERDDQKILECVHNVATQLLDTKRKTLSVETPQSRQGTKRDGDGKGDVVHPAPAIDPTTMIRSLSDINLKSPSVFDGRHFHGRNMLGGVIAMLFGQEETETIDLTRETWSGEDRESDPNETKLARNGKPSSSNPAKLTQLVASSESLISFKAEIDKFLHELARPTFAETCDAARMVEALAFPLLLCVRGSEAGWLPKSHLSRVAKRVTNVMFNQNFGKDKPVGLFAMLRSRYISEGLQGEFLNAVGDGTLWLILLAALVTDPTDSWQVLLPQASALASVFYCRELLALTDASRLSDLLDSLVIKNAASSIIGKVERIARAASELNSALSTSWDVLSKEQRSDRSSRQPANALLWSPKWGWYVTEDSPAETFHSGVINVQIASEEHENIQNAMKCVIEACM